MGVSVIRMSITYCDCCIFFINDIIKLFSLLVRFTTSPAFSIDDDSRTLFTKVTYARYLSNLYCSFILSR